MTTRTLRFMGLGYASSPVTIVATVDGTTVYSGPIPTLNQSTYDVLPEQQQVLFTYQCDTGFDGAKLVTISVTGGELVLAETLGNYYLLMNNPVFTSEQLAVVTNPGPPPRTEAVGIWTAAAVPALSSEEINTLSTGEYLDDSSPIPPILEAHNIDNQVMDPAGVDVWQSTYATDSRTDVTIDGVAQAPGPDGAAISRYVPAGSVIVFQQNIVASH